MSIRKFNIKVDGIMHEVEVEDLTSGVSSPIASTSTTVVQNNQNQTNTNTKKTSSGVGGVVAPLQGTVLDIKVNVGQNVNAGDVVAIIEAMKMENEIPSTVSGVVKSIVGMLSGSANPYQVLTGIAAKNPMIKNVMDSAKSSGKSYKDIFYELAKQKGVDPNNIISQLKF